MSNGVVVGNMREGLQMERVNRFFSGNSRDRRRQRRALGIKSTTVLVQPKVPAFTEGDNVRITVEQYGKSYHNTKGVVSGFEGDSILVTVKKRKSPLTVAMSHVERIQDDSGS